MSLIASGYSRDPGGLDEPSRLKGVADAALRAGRRGEAASLYGRALALDPDLHAARLGLAVALRRMGRFEAALAEVDALLKRGPTNLSYIDLRASILASLGCYDEAIDLHGKVLHRDSGNARSWLRYGHALRAAGRGSECIAAYRQATTRNATLGEAWWALADLKTFRFELADIAAMRSGLKRRDLDVNGRALFHMALGKALEDAGQYRSAFAHYASGNAARRTQVAWDGDSHHAYVLECERSLTPDLFAEHHGAGCGARDPIFIVGLPRAGSTLIEQILASHSQVEGTMELPSLGEIARRLCSTLPSPSSGGYLDAMAKLPSSSLAALGRTYLERTQHYRKTKRPLFIDKMPDNFNMIGFIHLILPNATIIDARRNAMATCFSAWKQYFISGQSFTYDLDELGRYYNDYVRLMDHYDRVLPGRVLRVRHEDLVKDTEAQVRRLLKHCGLVFEPECLLFHRNARPVRTASSEQVRRPISCEGVEHWRQFEPWLGELKAAMSCSASGDGAALLLESGS